MIKNSIRPMTEQALEANKRVVDWQLAQAKLAEKQIGTAFEAMKNTVEVTRDGMAQATAAWLDAVAPIEADAQK